MIKYALKSMLIHGLFSESSLFNRRMQFIIEFKFNTSILVAREKSFTIYTAAE